LDINSNDINSNDKNVLRSGGEFVWHWRKNNRGQTQIAWKQDCQGKIVAIFAGKETWTGGYYKRSFLHEGRPSEEGLSLAKEMKLSLAIQIMGQLVEDKTAEEKILPLLVEAIAEDKQNNKNWNLEASIKRLMEEQHYWFVEGEAKRLGAFIGNAAKPTSKLVRQFCPQNPDLKGDEESDGDLSGDEGLLDDGE
jgi:hypothetical protein